MTPISKSAPFGGKRHFSSSRGTSALVRAVSPALWRQPRTLPLYIGQSLASPAPSRAGGERTSSGPERRAVDSGSPPRRTKQQTSSRPTARLRIAMTSPLSPLSVDDRLPNGALEISVDVAARPQL